MFVYLVHHDAPHSGLPLQKFFVEDSSAVGSTSSSDCNPSDAGETSSLDGEPIDDVRPVVADAPASSDNAIYDMNDRWMLSLRSLWREHARREVADESRVIYVETWYLHHTAFPRCDRSREVRLDNADHYWLDDIRRVWIDRLAEGEPLHLSVVAPTPPRSDAQRCIAHVLLMQGDVPATVGVVFTARFVEDHQTHLIQEAISSPDWMSGTRAVSLLRIEPFIEHRRWIVRSGASLFDRLRLRISRTPFLSMWMSELNHRLQLTMLCL